MGPMAANNNVFRGKNKNLPNGPTFIIMVYYLSRAFICFVLETPTILQCLIIQPYGFETCSYGVDQFYQEIYII